MISNEIYSFLRKGILLGLDDGKLLIGWGEMRSTARPTDSVACFYAPDFYLEEKEPWLTFEHVDIVEREEFLAELDRLEVQGPWVEWRWEYPKKDDFEKVFTTIKAEIAKQTLEKAVPVVFARSKVAVTLEMRIELLRRLLKNTKIPTPYGFWTEQEGMLGASPEILFSHDLQESKVSTMALAGTRSTEKERTQPLTTDEKEMFEHQLVVNGLSDKLCSWGQLTFSPTYTWNLGPLCHLRTDLDVKLAKNADAENLFCELVQTLHPTAALGVAPITADWKWLKNADGQTNRRRFGAPFGFLGRKRKSFALVAIRGIQWSNYYAVLGSGCGIVKASELDKEWQELELKMRSVREIFGV